MSHTRRESGAQRVLPSSVLRSALLRLSNRIAEAVDEDEVCQGVAESLHDAAFGFDASAIVLTGAASVRPTLKASAGDYDDKPSARSEVRLPLVIEHSTIGELIVQRAAGAAFDQGDLEIVAAAANQAGIAIGRVRLLAAERRRLAEQRALLDTLTDLSGELELDNLLHAVLRRAITLLDVTGGELAIWDASARQLVIVASHNMDTNAVGTRMVPGEGAMGHVAETLEPLIIPRYQEWGGRSDQYLHSTIQTVMAAPLVINNRLVGAIASVHSDPARTFGQADLRVLNLFAAQAAIAIENARLFSAERDRATEQRALLDTLSDLTGELELEKVLGKVLERAVTLLNVTGGELAIFDEHADELVIAASHRMPVDATGTRMALGEGAMGQVALSREPLMIPRYQEWAERSTKYTHSTVQSVMAAPLVIGTRLVGAIASIHSDPSREFGEVDLRRLMMFAPQAAVAIENARLFSSAQRQYELLVQNNPVAIVNMDIDNRITSCNPAFERLFGWSQAEVVGRDLDSLVASGEALAEAQSYTEEVEAGSARIGMGQRQRKDGSRIDVEIFALPVMVGGRRTGMVALYHDVTALYQARRDAESANEAKSRFLAGMSHELRTPLNAIIGYSEMLEEDARGAGHEGYVPDLGKIRAAGKHLLTLINDVLDLSKVEAGKMELYLEAVAVRTVVDSVAATMQPLIEQRGNQFRLEVAGDLGTVETDQTRLRQILLNLLSNASKFTEDGTITLTAARVGNQGAERLEFAVIDSGIGMTSEQVGRLFQAFTQAEAATSARYGGTGLGLAISKSFAEMMGGTITVASREGEGTTFTVRLPVAPPAPAVAEPSTGRTVLVVDDDARAREMLTRILGRAGFHVRAAADGPTALGIARRSPPAVITLDVMMPGMDGWEVLSALKADPATAEVPVIMVSVLDERQMGFALGAADYVTKPVDRDRLLKALEEHAGDGDALLAQVRELTA